MTILVNATYLITTAEQFREVFGFELKSRNHHYEMDGSSKLYEVDLADIFDLNGIEWKLVDGVYEVWV